MKNISLSKELRQYATQNRKKTNEWFFKTGPGEYGAHDQFLGISNPDVRRVAKRYREYTLSKLQKLIVSPYNEERLCALVILVEQFSHRNTSEEHKRKIYDFYIKNIEHVNNWNLVDLSAPHIVGEYLFLHKKEQNILANLVCSDVQWHRRICILSTWAFIKRSDFVLTMRYAQKLLGDQEDLMHKSIGWMLREVWKKDQNLCENFLQEHYAKIPRTTLRYAIERMEENKRKRFLQGVF